MTNRTAWTGGNLNSGSIAYQAAFGSEINTLNSTYSVLSSIIFDNTNGTTGLDEFLVISAVASISSSTIAVGAALSFWLYPLQGDGTTYGDGRLTTTPVVSTTYSPPSNNAIGGISFVPGTTITTLAGSLLSRDLPPVKFALAAQNNCGFNFTSCSVWIRTYNQNLNS